ncbi:hypothetical protein ACT691_06985 [Vibrio metschnikovii]
MTIASNKLAIREMKQHLGSDRTSYERFVRKFIHAATDMPHLLVPGLSLSLRRCQCLNHVTPL